MLNFPNPSRSYDIDEGGVSFWGYDRAFEVTFFLEESALTKIDPDTKSDQVGFLSTFDANLEHIRAAANTVYEKRHKHSHIFSYTLTEENC